MSGEMTKRTGYSFSLVNISCLPGSDHFNILMDLEESIDDLLPFLAAGLAGCTYVHGSGVVNLMDTGHIVAIYPRSLTITDVTGLDEAEELCQKYFSRISYTRENMHSISPVYDKRQSLTVLDILRGLPRTNCGECGSPTCMAFAARVFRHEEVISVCAPVAREAEKHGELLNLLERKGYRIS